MNQRGTRILLSMLFASALAGWSLTCQAFGDTDELQAIEPGEGCYGALRGYLNQEQTQFDDEGLVPGGIVPPRRPAPLPPVQTPAPEPEVVPEPEVAPEPAPVEQVPTGILATDDDGSMNTAPVPAPTPEQDALTDDLMNHPEVQAIMAEHEDDDDNTALIAGLIAAGLGAALAALLAKKLWDKKKKGQLKISAPTGFKKVTAPHRPAPPVPAQPEKLPVRPARPAVAPAKPARPTVAPDKPARPTVAVDAAPDKIPTGIKPSVSTQAQKLEMIKAQQAQMATISDEPVPKAQAGVMSTGKETQAPLQSAALNVKAAGGYKQDPVTKKWTPITQDAAPIKGGATSFAEGPMAPSRPKPASAVSQLSDDAQRAALRRR